MSDIKFEAGQRVRHPEFGEGIVVSSTADGYVRVFFPIGERQVFQDAISPLQTPTEQMLADVSGGKDRLRNAWLYVEAHALPLMDNAAAMTAARIDLLPHQVVLTHRVATASPRRFLIADEVGLGKTIETALILREMTSRGELNRALMVVPAGLVNNWHRELNEVFNLDFEVFGAQGDVTDRRSNAFAKHDRLIASVDTLKRRARVKRLKEAPPWDLVVFDEAHHLSAYKSGRKVRKTENYKLAEALRDHARDLLLLSATPHQGDHFRFWMLIQLLNPTLFKGPDDMVDKRHRLNAVVYRRTKADACTPDGSPLFTRRWVHTEAFTMSGRENAFYAKLREYLLDGFNLAKQQGNKGRALGFVMTIFQKIAASSFAAVRSTLRRRQLSLTIHEAILKDQALDIDGHLALMNEAREMIHTDHNLPRDQVGRIEVDQMLSDLKLKVIKKMDEEELAVAASSESSEVVVAEGENLAATAIAMCLPEERLRIKELLAVYPDEQETKIEKLIRALGTLWNQNPNEKVVIFATYLSTVDLLSRAIDTSYPGQGVVVLRGGDHSSKLAAERRFRKTDGPRVMVCTAAGREGINLQFSRILFNFDLPWNPMDVEQRIGRIHRYGQQYTAQVYNLVLSDTIEGKIFLLLMDKLNEIARTLGKVDEQGNVTEDLRGQILGQLNDRLSYDQLYRDALEDPTLQRTQQELEEAMSNANEARKVVFELFQELDSFSLDEYKPLANIDDSKSRIIRFLEQVAQKNKGKLIHMDDKRFKMLVRENESPVICTLDRELIQEDDTLELMGLDHPIMNQLIQQCKDYPATILGATADMGLGYPAVLTVWLIQSFGKGKEAVSHVIPIAVNSDGKRIPSVEKQYRSCFFTSPGKLSFSAKNRLSILNDHIEPTLQKELRHRAIATPEKGYSSELLAWVELA
ncbi:Helicase conserved C-terminal domain-containing protein [Desulfocicer vacuolatum DSM 3385]|uniref:Helicase conserved C-terminal domain-containing protein n=1 Tax=Desulfocicer vacuolatum DSM 3385 TaxID=1121400 RepID=A0A1W2A449_9BACT|nr:SNF2-related protein [Desulfocicer vacuolatum]SMC55242.1 Helicase conserved C-terminal domain-containing protein [Desulfocicer vacuolatum DSM 3385]